MWRWLALHLSLLLPTSSSGIRHGDGDSGCTVAHFGAVPDNATDNTAAFRAAFASSCDEVVVPPGTWMTGPFNLSSHTVLRVFGTISGSRDPTLYPVVIQQPLDEAYRAPYMHNRQRQALISAYSAVNITVVGSGTVDGNGWDWWRNITSNVSNNLCRDHCPGSSCPEACLIQRPKLVEFVDCTDVTVQGGPEQERLTFKNSPFWTLHPTFSTNVRISQVNVLAPRDHGNTDGVDPDSCDNVHVSDVLIDVGDDAVSVKSGLHWKNKTKVAAQNYVFERVDIVFRNFAIGSDVSGDVRNITFRDSTIGDDLGSSPWAIRIKTDSQEGGIVDGVAFQNIRIGNITYCGSSRFVFTPPHARKDLCSPREQPATMIDIHMGYVGAKTRPGRVRNVVIDGLHGIGPSGPCMHACGLSNATGCPGCAEHIQNLTITNVSLVQGDMWMCSLVDGAVLRDVKPMPHGSCHLAASGGRPAASVGTAPPKPS